MDLIARKRKRRHSSSHGERNAFLGDPGDRRERLIVGTFLCALFGSVLALGSVHLASLVGLALIAIFGVLLLSRGEEARLPKAALVAAGLALYCLLQTLPLPLAWLSEAARDTWSRALLPWGEAGPAWGSISLDPTASRIEALRWAVLACVLLLASWVGRRRGDGFVLGAVFVSAVLVGALTLGHGLLGATRVYGLYQPTFTPYRWAVSPLLNPNNLSGYLNLGVFVGAGLLATSTSAPRRWLLGSGIALLVGQSVLSGSRGGVLTLLLGMLALAVALRRPSSSQPGKFRVDHWGSNGAGVLGALGLGLVMAWLGAQPETWVDLRQEGLEKLSVVRWALPMIAAHPLMGSGAGSFETVFPAYQVVGSHVVWTHPENFLVAWATEWGPIVAVAAALGFAWFFRPAQLGVPRSLRATSAFIGVLVLLVHNLADLAFAVPGVMVALSCVLGGLWGARRHKSTRLDSNEATPTRDSTLQTKIILLISVLSLLLVLVAGQNAVGLERRELHAQLETKDLRQPAESRHFFEQLQAAVRRHPAEPYFPLLGALAARAGAQDPLPWIARSLERDVMNGRTHLFLAQVLFERGARNQALLELRLAIEREPSLVWAAGANALNWVQTPDELWLVVPQKDTPPLLLYAFAHKLTEPRDEKLRASFLDKALERDPRFAPAHALLALDKIRDIRERRPPCAAELERCRREAEQHISFVTKGPLGGGSRDELTGQLIAAAGSPAEAVSYLSEHCLNTDEPCLRTMVTLSASAKLPLDEAAQSYLAITCTDPEPCARAHAWIGNLHAARAEWDKALKRHKSAVEQVESKEGWLQVVRSAERLGNGAVARDALSRAKTFGPITDPYFLELDRKLLLETIGPAPPP